MNRFRKNHGGNYDQTNVRASIQAQKIRYAAQVL